MNRSSVVALAVMNSGTESSFSARSGPFAPGPTHQMMEARSETATESAITKVAICRRLRAVSRIRGRTSSTSAIPAMREIATKSIKMPPRDGVVSRLDPCPAISKSERIAATTRVKSASNAVKRLAERKSAIMVSAGAAERSHQLWPGLARRMRALSLSSARPGSRSAREGWINNSNDHGTLTAIAPSKIALRR